MICFTFLSTTDLQYILLHHGCTWLFQLYRDAAYFGTTDACTKHYRRALICMHYGCALFVSTTVCISCKHYRCALFVSTMDVRYLVSTTDVHYLVSTTDVHYLVSTTDVYYLVSTTDVHYL